MPVTPDRKPYAAVTAVRDYLLLTRGRHLEPALALADLDRLAGLLSEAEARLMNLAIDIGWEAENHKENRVRRSMLEAKALLSKLRAERGEGQST